MFCKPSRKGPSSHLSAIGTFDAPPDRLDTVVAHFRDSVVPAFSKHDGFVGYRLYVDRERGRLVGISLWTTRAALEASVATARTALDGAARLGATIVGQPQTFAEAFDATLAR